MLQNDMTGYAPKDKMAHFGVVTDFTDGETTSFLKQLIEKYARITWVDTRCGYACSGRVAVHLRFVHVTCSSDCPRPSRPCIVD